MMDEKLTATQAAARLRDEKRTGFLVAEFIREFEPKDPNDRAEFLGALYSLIHAIHHDAAAPYMNLVAGAMAMFPPAPIVMDKPYPRGEVMK